MPRAPQRSVATLGREAAAATGRARFVDLAISLRVAPVDVAGDKRTWRARDAEELIRVGGRWDRVRRAWAGEATDELVLYGHDGQAAWLRWFAEWLRCTLTGDWTGVERAHIAMLAGARRSGKTFGALMALVLYAIAIPRSITWALSPTLENNDELDRELREMLPAHWYTRREIGTGKATRYTFANGSRLYLRSGHKPRTLRAGRVDVVLMNEAQNLAHAALVNLYGAIVDRAGLVCLACNPPDSAAGLWLEDLWLKIRAGEAPGAGFEFDARKNPFVSHETLFAMRAVVDEKTFARDALGLMGVPVGDRVFHAWSDTESWRDPPADFVDVTHELARGLFGKPFGYVAGCDFQRYPAMVTVIAKLLRAPADVEPTLCIVDEVIVPESDEYELLDELEALDRWTPRGRVTGDGYRGWIAEGDDPRAAVHVAPVIDASGFFQSGSHAKGERSDRMFASRRWSAFKPQKDSDKNPSILERVRLVNSLLLSHDGRRRLLVARHCKATAEAMRKWDLKLGTPYRRSPFAHLSDAVCYIAWRAFGGAPKVPSTGRAEYVGARQFDRAAQYGTYGAEVRDGTIFTSGKGWF